MSNIKRTTSEEFALRLTHYLERFFIYGPLIAGIAILTLFPGREFFEYSRTANWVEVPAVMEQIKLNQSASRLGRKNYWQYRVTGQYSYIYQGENYTSSRIGLADDRSTDQESQSDLYRKLSRAKNNGDPIDVFVNPVDPNQSVIIRKLDWTKILQSIFFGGLLTIGGFVLMQTMTGFPRRSIRIG